MALGKHASLLTGFVLLALSSLLNAGFAWVSVPVLGDGGVIAVFMLNPTEFPAAKYLVGMSLIRELFSAWDPPALARWLPLPATGLAGFIRIVGTLLMVASTLLLLVISRSALRIVLAVTTPIWLLFSIGYIEYYPFIAGVFLAFLYWVFSRPLQSQSAPLIAAACVALPLMYAGFAPYSLIVLALYLYGSSVKTIAVTLLSASAAFLALIWIFWAGGLGHFFNVLLQELNLGERNTMHDAYKGLAAGDQSIFFSLGYVFSLQHLREVLQMIFGGMGIVAAGLIPVGIGLLPVWRKNRTRDDVLPLSIAGWALAYLFLMIPKLGPVQDLDLFFSSYLVLAFVTGMQLERYSSRVQMWVLLAWLAGSALSMSYLFTLAP